MQTLIHSPFLFVFDDVALKASQLFLASAKSILMHLIKSYGTRNGRKPIETHPCAQVWLNGRENKEKDTPQEQARVDFFFFWGGGGGGERRFCKQRLADSAFFALAYVCLKAENYSI